MSGSKMDDSGSRSQVVRDAAMALPFLAAVLLTPPFIIIFAAPASVGSIPLIVAYLFSVWAVIIVVAFVIARRLAAAEAAEAGGDDEAPTR